MGWSSWTIEDATRFGNLT